MRPRALFIGIAATLFVWLGGPGALGRQGQAFADDRPPDAPLTTADESIPPLPPEYLTHDGGWLTVGYHPSARERIRPILSQADGIAEGLARELGRPRLDGVELRVAALNEEMARLSPVERSFSPGATSFPDRRLIVMSLTAPLSADPPNLEAQFRHQLAHLALYEAWGSDSPPPPAWFEEAYAVHASGEGEAMRAQTLTLASLRNQMLSLDELGIRFPADLPQASIARAQAADFIRFLTAEPSGVPFAKLIESARRGETLREALASAYGAENHDVEQAFRDDMAKRYSFLPVLFGGALLWLLLATLSVVRRARSERRRKEAAESVAAPTGELRTVVIRGRIEDPEDPASELPPHLRTETMLPTIEVPKVEHDGRWHTLH